MTTFAANSAAAAAPWMSRAELAQASGLREDLIARFIPATDTPNGPMYPAQQMALAVYVKELTDHNLPPAAIDEKVREFTTRPPAPAPFASAVPPTNRRGVWAAVGGAAAGALILGGVLGGIIGSSTSGRNAPSTPATVTVQAAAPEFDPTIPASPDPVCAEWGPISNSYGAKLAEWSKTDSTIPSSSWSPEQKALNLGIVPVLQAQADDLNRLADKAQDPFLARLMREQALYEKEFASRIPNYEPSDQALWRATADFAGAVRATCLTVKPR